MRDPWQRDDGGTDVDAWLEAYNRDRQVIWYSDLGDVINVLETLIERANTA